MSSAKWRPFCLGPNVLIYLDAHTDIIIVHSFLVTEANESMSETNDLWTDATMI